MKRTALAALLLTACATTPQPETPTGKVAVLTDPPDATITFVDGSTCQTPCEVTVPIEMAIIVAKAGYKAVRADLSPEDGPSVTYTLAPVGRSAPVEVFELEDEPGS